MIKHFKFEAPTSHKNNGLIFYEIEEVDGVIFIRCSGSEIKMMRGTWEYVVKLIEGPPHD